MESRTPQDQLFSSEDEGDVNPYASPQASCCPTEPVTIECDVRGVWRDGDELVMICHDAVAPRACCLTNRDEQLERWYYPMFGRRVDWLAITVIVWIPFSSLFVLLLSVVPAALIAHVPGNIATINLWFHRRMCYGTVWYSFAMFGSLAYTLASVAAGCALLFSSWIAAAVSYGVVALGVMLTVIAERLKPVQLRAVDGFIRIGGVHPDYLARLDDFATRKSSD